MCFTCEAVDFSQFGIDPPLVTRARRIDAAMPGLRVPDIAWKVALGEEHAPIPWPVLRRMMECLDKAANALCARLRCEAVAPDGATAR
jgi:hypothetical protein